MPKICYENSYQYLNLCVLSKRIKDRKFFITDVDNLANNCYIRTNLRL